MPWRMGRVQRRQCLRAGRGRSQYKGGAVSGAGGRAGAAGATLASVMAAPQTRQQVISEAETESVLSQPEQDGHCHHGFFCLRPTGAERLPFFFFKV